MPSTKPPATSGTSDTSGTRASDPARPADVAPFALWEARGGVGSIHPDDVWRTFVAQAELKRVIVRDVDVASYDADNHALVLAARGGAAPRTTFDAYIVLLGDERVSGGLRIEPFSARAILHPVVFSSRIEERDILVFRPALGPGPGDWQNVAGERLEAHFRATGKVEHPRSEPRYRALEGELHTTGELSLSHETNALVFSYSTHGAAPRRYVRNVALDLVHGNTSASVVSRRDEPVEMAGATQTHRIELPYAELARMPGLRTEPPFKSPGTMWRATVWLRPVLTPDERADVGLCERARLDGSLVLGMSELRRTDSVSTAVDWDKLGR